VEFHEWVKKLASQSTAVASASMRDSSASEGGSSAHDLVLVRKTAVSLLLFSERRLAEGDSRGRWQLRRPEHIWRRLKKIGPRGKPSYSRNFDKCDILNREYDWRTKK
jgi:hypothetical protein